MDKNFFKGLLLFAAGYLTARWLIKNGTTAVPGTSEVQTGGVNLDGVLQNVKSWISTNFPEVGESDAIEAAKEAVGLKTGQELYPGNNVSIGVDPTTGNETVMNANGQELSFNQYQSDGILGGGGFSRFSPDKNDFFQAKGGRKTLTGKIQDDYTWSFN